MRACKIHVRACMRLHAFMLDLDPTLAAPPTMAMAAARCGPGQWPWAAQLGRMTVHAAPALPAARRDQQQRRRVRCKCHTRKVFCTHSECIATRAQKKRMKQFPQRQAVNFQGIAHPKRWMHTPKLAEEKKA